ncbi:MAG: 50S ribosomal protein L3 [Pedosphaera sp.]|nr:50S ribosomal protein L3 [Pedosphaera sp.]MSU42757.1 50S ribosomal protein L3 [Pedosphaera sp.]
MIGLIGKKLGQTRVFDSAGNAVGVTVVLAGPNRVLQCKTMESDQYNSVQLGFDDQKESRVTKSLLGHFKKSGSAAVKQVREFRNFTLPVKAGDVVGVDIFSQGDYVDAIGVSKGKGFAGVVRRYKYAGGPASHGQKGWHRRPGAIGCRSTPGWVIKGKGMPGHMGQRQRTVQNLQVMAVRTEDNLLLIQGSIPGANGDYVIIRESKKNAKVPAKK